MQLPVIGHWRDWINYRNPRCWVLVFVVLYSLAGFLLLPWLLRDQLPALAESNIARRATVEKVQFNPWTLHLRAYGLTVEDTGDEPLATAASLRANLQLRSLVRFALVFRELELVEPRIRITRYAFDDSNVARLARDMEQLAPADPEPTTGEDEAGKDEAGGLLRLVADSIAIVDGSVLVRDELPAEPFSTELGPINIALTDISTLPDESGDQQVNIVSETGAEVSWTGQLTIAPFKSSGTLTVSGTPLPLVYRYLKDQLNFDFDNCCLDLQFDYDVAATPDGGIEAALDGLQFSMRELIFSERDGERVFELPELAISGGSLRWPEGRARIEALTFTNPQLDLWLNEDGSLNLTTLLPAAPASSPADEAQEEEAPEEAPAAEPAEESGQEPGDEPADPLADWDISLGELRLDGLLVSFADRSLETPGKLQLDSIYLSANEISNGAGAAAPFSLRAAVSSGGRLTTDGTVTLLPAPVVTAEFAVADVALNALQPWVQDAAFVSVDEGLLEISGTIDSTPEETLTLQADIGVNGLQVSDTTINEPLVGWQRLAVEQLNLQLDANDLQISRIRLSGPNARLLIDEQSQTNFQQLAKPAPETPAPAAPAEAGEPLRIRIGETVLETGRLDFTDLALPLPFRAVISDFGGKVTAFASDSSQPSALDFSGKVGEFGLSEITGAINLTDPTRKADIEAVFRNISMPDLSPYTAEFVGRKIESGKLELDLNYSFEDRLIRGANNVVLNEFQLGEKVDNPEAMNLPLDLAVGLLKDINGVIDLDLKVSGDLDDPSFSASGIILKAFANLITKAVAAPFKLLGNLVPGLEAEDSNEIVFAAGIAELTPPEQEKLALISEALAQRPELVLDAPGGFVGDVDRAGLQRLQAEALLQAEVEATEDAEQLLRRQRRALERLVRENALGEDERIGDLRDSFVNADTGELDEVAWMDDLRGRLEASITVSDAELAELGNARQQAIVSEVEARGLDTSRIRAVAEPKASESKDGRVQIELGLEAT